MSLLTQLKDLKSKYLETNSAYLRTPIFLAGGIPLKDDPDKATRKLLIPHYVIWHGLPATPRNEPDAGADMPEQTPEDELEDVIA
jgi:hypothetical protein